MPMCQKVDNAGTTKNGQGCHEFLLIMVTTHTNTRSTPSLLVLILHSLGSLNTSGLQRLLRRPSQRLRPKGCPSAQQPPCLARIRQGPPVGRREALHVREKECLHWAPEAWVASCRGDCHRRRSLAPGADWEMLRRPVCPPAQYPNAFW